VSKVVTILSLGLSRTMHPGLTLAAAASAPPVPLNFTSLE
jgi:hypothetical protein